MLFDFMGIKESITSLYSDRVDFLQAREDIVHGRICRNYEPMRDPCDNSRVLIGVCVQFLHDNVVAKDVQDGRKIVKNSATIDVPFLLEDLSVRDRVRFCGESWDITSIQVDALFGNMRLGVEIVES